MKAQQSKPAILWDMDGTLAPTNEIHERAFQEVLLDLGIRDFSYDRVRGWKTIRVFESYGFTGDRLQELVQRKQNLAYQAALEFEFPLKSLEILRSFSRAGFLQAIVTGASERFTKTVMRSVEVEGLIQCWVVAENSPHSKPDPSPFLLACEALGVRPSDCFVVEDSEEVLQNLLPLQFRQLLLIGSSSKNAKIQSIEPLEKILSVLSS
jgi:HAD superfamily hydrolase (TIGR01509 family)